MKALKIFTALCLTAVLSTSLSAQEKEDKIGTVNMQKLVHDYYKAEKTREAFKGYEKEIQAKNETRIDAIKAAVGEAREFQKQGDAAGLTREKKEGLFKMATAKNQEAQGLVQARQEWLDRKRSALSEKAKVEFSILRTEIIAIIHKAGDEKGYDFIFDRSGSSGADVPILSYAKDVTDLTATLLTIINKDDPAKGATGEPKSE